ncbi:MAG: hypothetical protein KGI33_08115 [Thaumarchaeota archaeon]|nr:hypothetical protein [Nitrososphaerota archaeon]
MRMAILSALFLGLLLSTDAALAASSAQQPCVPATAPGGENLPSPTSIKVLVCSSYSYKAPDGRTVVLGEIQNNNDFPITGLKVGITFEDANSNVLEYKTGTTLLQVVEPNSLAPFSISSTKADPSITQVSVNLAGFTSASPKDQILTISPGPLQFSDTLTLAGTIKNGGKTASTNTRLYLISYDPFQRVVAIGNETLPAIGPGETANFTLTSMASSRAKTFEVLAESDDYQSLPTDVTKVLASLPVIVEGTNVTNPSGASYPTIPVDAPVKITSSLRYLLDAPQSYTYYVQIKKFGGQVAFIGNSTGVFLGGNDNEHTESVSWTPTSAGSYYVETYVWDSNGVPLASAGTRVNIVLVR